MNDLRMMPARTTPKPRRSLGSAIDWAIAPLFPGWANRRQQARLHLIANRLRTSALATFGAAIKDRFTRDWAPSDKSADAAIVPDLSTMTPRARLALLDDDIAVSIRSGYRRHVVGIGITPRANARHPDTHERLADFNAGINREFGNWAVKPDYVDKEKRKTFAMCEELAIDEMVAVGESLCILSYEPRPETVGLVLQMVEPEQLDTSKAKNLSTGNEIRGGVEIDSFGAPVAYHVYTQAHPLDSYRFDGSERVPADRVIHLLRPDRVRQTRGYTWLHAVLKKMRHFQMYQEYQVVAARFEAAICAFIKQDAATSETNPLSLLTGDTTDDGKDSKQNPELALEPGAVIPLQNGQDVILVDPKRPGTLYEPYTKHNVAAISAGAGLDYHTVARDYTGTTYVGLRMGKGELDDEIDPIQRLMIDLFCRTVWEWFVRLAVLENRVAAPHYRDSAAWTAAYHQANWQGPPKRDVDPAKSAAARKIDLENVTDDLERIHNERGGNWRDAIDQRAEVAEYAAEKVVTVPWLGAAPKASPSEPKPRQVQPEENQ